MGWGAWAIRNGQLGDVSLGGTALALYYRFPGRVEDGQGSACAYIDSRATQAQQRALETIGTGQAGGGIFALFGQELVTHWLPTKHTRIDFDLQDGVGRVLIEGYGAADSELLSYPDGSVIRPIEELPHGIEFKRALMTNSKRWWWRDDDLLATYADKYGAVAKVHFTQECCIG